MTSSISRAQEAGIALRGKMTEAQAIEIVDDASFVAAGELLKWTRARKKAALAEIDPIIKDQYSAYKRLRGLKTKIEKAADQIERRLKAQIEKYHNRLDEEEKRIAAEATSIAARRRQLEEAAGVKTSMPVVVPAIALKRPAVEGVGVSSGVPDFEIVDASAISREFLKPDEVAIRKAVRSLGFDAERVVGGIRVYKKRTVSVTV